MNFNPFKLLIVPLILIVNSSLAQFDCLKTYQKSIGNSSYPEIAYDIADAGNSQYFVAGETETDGAKDIIITKHDPDGSIIWAKKYGASKSETVRKITSTLDGGLLIAGQTNSFAYDQGEMLCFKIDKDGNIVWSRKFGLGTNYGELAMDLIQSTDGGYVISGIINVQGVVADLSLIRMDENANILWAKRFDSNEGENGVGLLQKGDTLIVSGDIDNNASLFNAIALKFNINNGNFYTGKKIVPSVRGLFNSHIFKDNSDGYWISAHMIDGNSYANMQHTILKLDNSFNITKTYKIDINGTYANDYYTGFVPTQNGFYACGSEQVNSSGYFFYVKDDGSLVMSKRFAGNPGRKLNALALINQKIITAGTDNSSGESDLFVAGFGTDGFIDTQCHPDTALASVSNPDFTVSDFTWPNVSDVNFGNTGAILSVNDYALTSSSLCDACAEKVVTANFTAPDTVCVNTPVSINNTTAGASSYYWSFCAADINQAPEATNIGNIDDQFSLPVFMDVAEVNGLFYGFVVNNFPGQLVRLDFGNSMLNTPTAVNLGNFGGVLQNNAEGIQVVKNEGKWYALIVGGYPNGGTIPFIMKVDFGNDITNINPVATNWGNIGNMDYPIDLHIFQESGNWYGFTVNSENSTITRFNFGNSFDNTPTALNLGNIGSLNYPTGIYAIKDNNNWRVFITNALGGASITRLDFGASLLNTPTGVNLGNPGGLLFESRDIYIIKYCGDIAGFITNGPNGHDDLIRLNFNNDITSVPSAETLGNIGNFSLPHSLSNLFRAGADLYSFVPNAHNNTLSRLRFPGCQNVSVPNTDVQNPPNITYSQPGTYNINLMVDEGLPTQTSICKSIVVLAAPLKSPTLNLSFCSDDSVRIVSSVADASYTWNNGIKDSFVYVNNSGTYWVENAYASCASRDSFNVVIHSLPKISLGNDTAFCSNINFLLDAGNSGSTYVWQDGSAKQTFTATGRGNYSVIVTNINGCVNSDSINVALLPKPVVAYTANTSVCKGASVQLGTGNSSTYTYSWSPPAGLANPSDPNPLATPADTTKYMVNVTGANGCVTVDSVTINVLPLPAVSTLNDTAVCYGSSVALNTVSTGNSFSWSPSMGLSDASSINPVASPVNAIQYIVTATSTGGCTANDSVLVDVLPLPTVTASSDVLICTGSNTSLGVVSPNAVQYQWYPTVGLNNSNIANPVASPVVSTNYHVIVFDIKGCSAEDSLLVSVKQKPVFTVNPPSAGICTGESVLLTAGGGDSYQWFPSNTVANPNRNVTTVSPSATTKYKVVITDNICGITDSVFTSVTITPLPNITVSKSNDVDCVLGEAKLIATGGTRYTWTPAVSLSNSNVGDPVATPTETTTYHVKVGNSSGCTGEDSIQVKVIRGDVANGYLMPSAFTPNNDGNNDCLSVKKWGALSSLDFSVYNRWGQLIFHTNNSGNCWDGTYKGVPQPTGAYVYQIRAKTLCGDVYRKGTAVLIR